MRNVSDKSCRDNQITHFVFHNFFPENREVYEIIWKNNVQSDRPQMTTLRIACWITKLTFIHSELDYIKLIAFPLQQWLHDHASMLRLYVYACLIITEMKSVYFAVRMGSLNKTVDASSIRS
jgi:hypothetical protein